MSPTSRARAPQGQRLAAALDRPEVTLRVAPLGALYVGLVQLTHSRYFASTADVVGFCLCAAFYAAQLLLLTRDTRWSRSTWAVAILAPAPFACLVFDHFLVDPMPEIFWAWLIAPVLMMCAYLLRPRDLVVAGGAAIVAGSCFFVASGVDLRSDPWLLVILLVAWIVPCLLTRRVLGDLRDIEARLHERIGQDPLTGVLNRQGLDDQVSDLVERHDPDTRVSVLVVEVRRLKQLAELEGNVVVGSALARTATVLTHAYRRDHLVARLRGDTFVVVTTHDAVQLGSVLAAEVRRANATTGLTASIGGVARIPLAQLTPATLGGILQAAEQRAFAVREADDESCVIDDLAAVSVEPGPVVPAIDLDDLDEQAPAPPGRGESSHVLLGGGLAITAILAVAIPPAPGPNPRHDTLLAIAAVLAALAVPIARGRLTHPVAHVAPVLAALVVVTVAVPAADGAHAAAVALVVLLLPIYLAALTLPMSTALWFSALLPLSVSYALFLGPFPSVAPQAAMLAMVGFGLVTVAIAVWVRRRRDLLTRRLALLALCDLGTGTMSREGLVARYRGIPDGTSIAVVYLDVDDMEGINRAYGVHGGDAVLRSVGRLLREVVAPHGTVARVGGDEFVLLLPGEPGESGAPTVVRRLTERLAALDVPITLSLGQAFGATDGEGTLWRLLAQADEALLLNRARARPGSVRSL